MSQTENYAAAVVSHAQILHSATVLLLRAQHTSETPLVQRRQAERVLEAADQLQRTLHSLTAYAQQTLQNLPGNLS